MEIKTLKQAKELGFKTFTYPSGNGQYEDHKGYGHLFINGEEVLPEVKKLNTILYPNGDGEYQDYYEGCGYFFRDDKELSPDGKKVYTYLPTDDDGEDENGKFQILLKGDKNEN